MRAVGYKRSLPIEHPCRWSTSRSNSRAAGPRPAGAVKAVSVNPVDTKVRMRAEPEGRRAAKVLG